MNNQIDLWGNEENINKEQEAIDCVLLSGTGYENGKKRILQYFLKNISMNEKIALLKNEYGTGGGTVVWENGKWGFERHNAKGIEITLNVDNWGERIKITWRHAAKCILKLIESGRYE